MTILSSSTIPTTCRPCDDFQARAITDSTCGPGSFLVPLSLVVLGVRATTCPGRRFSAIRWDVVRLPRLFSSFHRLNAMVGILWPKYCLHENCPYYSPNVMEVQRSNQCIEASAQCRHNNGGTPETMPPYDGIEVDGSTIPIRDLHGPGLAATFAEQLVRTLTSSELAQLCSFLQDAGGSSASSFSIDSSQLRLD